MLKLERDMGILRRNAAPDTPGNRLKRLARNIDALAEKDDRFLAMAHEIAELRRNAAVNLYAICREFVTSVNTLLNHGELTLDPGEFSESNFRDEGLIIFQVSVRGRILQIAISATPELLSTEDFRIPYTLLGTVRAFNQDLLERELIEEQLLFFTVEKERKMWRFFDPRTYRSGGFDQDYLVCMMEQLL